MSCRFCQIIRHRTNNMHRISKKCVKAILWASSYVSTLLFALVGGYVWIKNQDEDINKEVKHVFVDAMIFIGVDLILTLLESIAGLFSLEVAFVAVVRDVAKIAKIVIYLIGIGSALLSTPSSATTDLVESTPEQAHSPAATSADVANYDSSDSPSDQQ